MTRDAWLLALAAAVVLAAAVRWYRRWHWRDDRGPGPWDPWEW